MKKSKHRPKKSPTTKTTKTKLATGALEMVRQYVRLVKEAGGRSPSLAALAPYRNTVRYHFGTREALDAFAREKHRSTFKDVPVTDISISNPTRKTVLITSLVIGKTAHPGFLACLQRTTVRKKADLILLPTADPASRHTPNGVGRLDKTLADSGAHVIHGRDFALNDNLQILGIEITAKQLLPLTGLRRLGQRGHSAIVAAPKLFLDLVATPEQLPHALMTTGACTMPDYETDKHASLRTAYLAAQDHEYAALIVEIESNKRFHFRQLQYNPTADNLIDLGVSDTGEKISPQAVHLGDWHSGETAPENFEFARKNPFGAREVYLHDSFNGLSINHHDPVLQRKLRTLTLEDELQGWVADMRMFLRTYEKAYIVQSNHDEWLTHWIDYGTWRTDDRNFMIGHKLETLRIANPGTTVLELYARTQKLGKNLEFIGPNHAKRIGPVAMPYHGHVGPNGLRKPSVRAFEESVGPCNLGHIHTPAIWRNVWRAGTSTHLKLGYNDGPSSWLWSHILVYPDGRRQLYNIIPK